MKLIPYLMSREGKCRAALAFYASALGGVNFMEFFGETVRTAHIPISQATWMYLEKHLVLVYTGKSRLSGDIHTHVWGGYGRKEPSVVNAIEQMKSLARAAEQMGFAGIALPDHVAMPAGYKAVHPSGPRHIEHYTRFRLTESGVSPVSHPGMAKGNYLASGIEHTESGAPTASRILDRRLELLAGRWHQCCRLK